MVDCHLAIRATRIDKSSLMKGTTVMFRLSASILLVLLGFCAYRPAAAAPQVYTVEFSCYGTSSPTCQNVSPVGQYGPFGTEVLAWHGWVSLGFANGSTMQNATGTKISAIRMKVKNQGDSFKVGPIAGGPLFSEVYRKKADSSELIFNQGPSGTGVDDGVTFWSRVVPKSPGYNTSTPDFDGLASASDFTDPQMHPDAWERISPPNALWDALRSTAPLEADKIEIYAESDGPKPLIVYLSHGTLKFFDADRRKHYRLNASIPSGVNRISFAEGKFTVWKDGDELIRFSAKEPPPGREILQEPHKHKAPTN